MLPHMPESVHTGIRPEVSLPPFRALESASIKRRRENRPQCSPQGDQHGHEGTWQRAGVSAAKDEDGNKDPCTEAAKNCLGIHKNVKNVVLRAVCLQILDSLFQESSLRGHGTLLQSVTLFLEVLMFLMS